jgi:hypothetical protein
MPSWKKVITSGSSAALNSLTVTNGITGSLLGTSSYATSASQAISSSFAINASSSLFAVSSSRAVSSSFATLAASATSATTATTASFATLAASASFLNPLNQQTLSLSQTGTGVTMSMNALSAGGCQIQFNPNSTINVLFDGCCMLNRFIENYMDTLPK